MEQEQVKNIIENTELIQDNTEAIKNTGIKIYTQERQKRIWEALLYSHQRMDLLLITISGAGIYVCLEAIKFNIENNISSNVILKEAAFLLLVSIILNFISQKVSSKIHEHDYSVVDIDLTCEEENFNKEEYKEQKELYEKKICHLEKLNDIFSYFSLIYMGVGLMCLIYFFMITF